MLPAGARSQDISLDSSPYLHTSNWATGGRNLIRGGKIRGHLSQELGKLPNGPQEGAKNRVWLEWCVSVMCVCEGVLALAFRSRHGKQKVESHNSLPGGIHNTSSMTAVNNTLKAFYSESSMDQTHPAALSYTKQDPGTHTHTYIFIQPYINDNIASIKEAFSHGSV